MGFANITDQGYMDRKWIILIAVIAALASFQFRYHIVSADNYAYRLDRWTGEVVFLAGDGGRQVKWE